MSLWSDNAVLGTFFLLFCLQSLIWVAGKRRGRNVPMNTKLNADVPPFASKRVILVTDLLLWFAALGVWLFIATSAYLILTLDPTSQPTYDDGFGLYASICVLMVSARPLFISTAWAFAELTPEADPAQVDRTTGTP